MSSYALEVEGLTKIVGGNKRIVDEATFQMDKGEILGLLGPNGAGKTTTIRMIVGLISKSEGKVIINGRDLDSEGQRCKEEIGAIIENPAFYDHMSGFKNLKQYARMARQEITDERIMDVVKLVKMDHAIHDKVKKYSLGMKQRLGVAQAILHKPAVLILDEPTNGLDPQGIRDLRDYLKILAQQGTSTLVSSHLLSEMQLMCDRVAIMEHGKIIDVSSISALNDNGDEDELIVSFKVKQLDEASALVEKSELEVTNVADENNSLQLKMKSEMIPKINKLLVENNIDVYAIESAKTSLEEKFLKLTTVSEKG
ncbi:ABC transporter ATP-binding protein [Evansella cellulosilytica]|uniref:ABC transporter related protein n=1 Tax=Evansella cellulosilytica (strain ATCC 21833 / DSM 2522 / FERM P-1141 / JCM 9156 / N-4) TaxID=649639 RepID=E6TWP2_EVAC2|nr:ABC transporter ATP-binding protein [Evansella cellulosilytica]ADU28725.1 ABC transporter related protein [Evansella cellulosilytica DSM 2522]